jgi:hypothetical protein
MPRKGKGRRGRAAVRVGDVAAAEPRGGGAAAGPPPADRPAAAVLKMPGVTMSENDRAMARAMGVDVRPAKSPGVLLAGAFGTIAALRETPPAGAPPPDLERTEVVPQVGPGSPTLFVDGGVRDVRDIVGAGLAGSAWLFVIRGSLPGARVWATGFRLDGDAVATRQLSLPAPPAPQTRDEALALFVLPAARRSVAQMIGATAPVLPGVPGCEDARLSCQVALAAADVADFVVVMCATGDVVIPRDPAVLGVPIFFVNLTDARAWVDFLVMYNAARGAFVNYTQRAGPGIAHSGDLHHGTDNCHLCSVILPVGEAATVAQNGYQTRTLASMARLPSNLVAVCVAPGVWRFFVVAMPAVEAATVQAATLTLLHAPDGSIVLTALNVQDADRAAGRAGMQLSTPTPAIVRAAIAHAAARR